jgi:hypothetical protein
MISIELGITMHSLNLDYMVLNPNQTEKLALPELKRIVSDDGLITIQDNYLI